MNKRKIIRKFFRGFLWFLLSIGAILLLLIGLLQLPAVQNRLTDELEKSLSTQLKTEVQIGQISIDFPKMLTVEDVYLEAPTGDSLFALGRLGVNLNMLRLFRREVHIQTVEIESLFANIAITDSSSNIAFLLDAFLPSDTLTEIDTVSPTVDSTLAWTINLRNTQIALKDADIYYQDDPTGILFNGAIGSLTGQSKDIDLAQQQFLIRTLNLASSDIFLRLQEPTAAPDTLSTAPPAIIQVLSDQLSIATTSFRMESEDLNVAVTLPSAALEEAQLHLGNELQFSATNLSIAEGSYAMDFPAPPLTSGLDYNHLGLQAINIELKNFFFTPDSIHLQSELLQIKEKSGLVLENLIGTVTYTPVLLDIEELHLTTKQSSIDISNLQLQYDFQKSLDANTSLQFKTTSKADIAISDLFYLLPQIDTIDLLRQNQDQHLLLELQGAGNQDQLAINRIALDALGIRFRGEARIQNALQIDSIAGGFQLSEFSATPKAIIPLFPDTLFPTYIKWPQALIASGNAAYRNDQLKFDFRASEERDSTFINSVLQVSGKVENLSTYPKNTRIGLNIDTLKTASRSALAYLPPNSVPKGYQLPDFLQASGTINGLLEDLEINLKVATQSDRTSISVEGKLQQLTQPDSLTFDLNIPQLIVDIPELRDILPDSTLPSDLNFPDFRITDGQLDGKLDHLNFRLPFNTINGDGLFRGHYDSADYWVDAEISGFRLDEFYQGARADTLAKLNLDALHLTMESVGQLQPELNASLNLNVFEGQKGTLINLQGIAIRDTFQGNMTFSHTDLQGTAEATFIQADSTTLSEIQAKLTIDRADLERWRLSDRALYLSGQTRFSTKGLTTDDLSARLYLNDILLRSDTSAAFVDTLFAYAEMHNGNNEIEVFSDLLNFSLEGKFRPILVVGEIQRFIQAYWQENMVQPDPVVFGNYVQAHLEIRNPDPLTSGIIPGLTELSPLMANFIYREKAPELLITAEVPLLNYAGIIMDSLVVDTKGTVDSINYQADWENINIADQIILGKTRLSGKNTAKEIGVNFQVWDEEDQIRHHIKMNLDPEQDSFSLKLYPEQLIDRATWSIPADNRILIKNNSFRIANWRLRKAEQEIIIKTPNRKEVVLELNAIDLVPFGRLIRSEEEIAAGVLDGVVKVSNPLTEPQLDAQLGINDLSIYSKLWGDLSLQLANQSKEQYKIDLQLKEAGNDLTFAGTFVPNGALNLQLNIGALQLSSVEPLSLGYLSEAQGHLDGSLAIGGSFSNPNYKGQLQFVDAAMDVELLQTRFRISQTPIRFNGQVISIDRLSFYDTQNNEASLSGTLTARSIADYEFDLSAKARDFLVLNTDKDDNPLYYGYLRADADVFITGDLYQPELEVTASPKKGSKLTYQVASSTLPKAESRSGVVRFVEKHEWQQTIVADSIKQQATGESRGFALTTNLNVNPDLEFTVVIDPLTGDQFVGRGDGDIVFRQFPDGRMEMTGRVEMVKGLYDFTYQGLINRQFSIEPGSAVSWQGDPLNPNLDLSISSYIKASPFALVNEFAGTSNGNLRRQQTFAVRMYLKGTLEEMQVSTDIIYPKDQFGNTGLPAIDQSLSSLRNDQSQLNTQAFGLLLFKGFVNFGDSGVPGGGIDNSVQSGLNNVLSQQLNNLANRYINFVELDFGMESFNTNDGGTQRDLRLSLRKRLFNDRLIISLDGVTQTGETDADNSLPQSYLDNLTAEFLLSKNGGLRLKVFSDRELDQFTTGDVIRVGGNIAFSKDFNRFFWSSDKNQSKKPKPNPSEKSDATLEENDLKIEQE